MKEFQTPLSLAGTGVILIIVGMAVEALVPKIANIGHFVAGVGWVAIFVAILIFLIALISRLFNSPPA
jgi:Na+-transporting methylmalonyl-CoA/oxaloacetate decarboxylase gamma subunit